MRRLALVYALTLLVACPPDEPERCPVTIGTDHPDAECPPPDTWKELQDGPDAGARPTADDELDLDLEAENVNDSRGY